MRNELGEKIMTKFFGLKAKTFSYQTDDSSEEKKGKDTKKCDIKIQQIFKSERYNVFAEELNKITLSSNDDKRIH